MDAISLGIGLAIGVIIGILIGILIKEFLGNKLTTLTRDNSGRIIEISEMCV